MIFAQYDGTIKLEQITVAREKVEKTMGDSIHQSVSCPEGEMGDDLQTYVPLTPMQQLLFWHQEISN